MQQNIKLVKSKQTISSIDDLNPTHSKHIQIDQHQFDANNSTIDGLLESVRKAIKDNRLTGKFIITYNLGNVSGASIEISSTNP